ncbi:MAG TPA: fatty acid desaturase [Vicinamibacterales bacterium]|nr:fatty acid desaturase [Vicinamibacterales bacterium]
MNHDGNGRGKNGEVHRSASSVPAAGVSLQKVMARYAVPRYGPAVSNLLSSVTLYVGLIGAACVALRFSAWLAGGLSVVAAGFLLRTFIVFHDCAHGSFVPSKRANALLGAALGVLVYTPFALWRRQHAIHHATAGDLDRRGVGDVHTLTVEEYLALPWWGRLRYWLFRNPVVMFGLGPLWVLLLGPRLVSWSYPRRLQRSVLGTDLVLVVVIATLCWLLGWQGFLIVQLPALLVSGSIGIWLFYVQHQFEDTYWQSNESWSYDDAALQGSSYLRLPRVLQFLTGNIGLHHVHHLNARIPNYNLPAAHDENAALHSVPTISLLDGLRATRLKLWDERQRKLVGFRVAHATPTR